MRSSSPCAATDERPTVPAIPSTNSILRDVSEAWVAEKSLPEMEFTLGGAHELTDPDVRIMLATDAQGRIQAVTSWRPLFGQNGAVDGYGNVRPGLTPSSRSTRTPPSFPLPPSA